MFQMPSTIGANVLNNEATRSSSNLTASLIASIVHTNVVDIALSITAPSESHQDVTPSNCLMKKFLTVDNALFIAFCIVLIYYFILSIATVIMLIYSYV